MSAKKNRIIICSILGLLMIIGISIWGRKVYLTSDAHISRVVTIQTNQLISKHDLRKIDQISGNHKTAVFLKRVNKTARLKDTSGYQGQENGLASYNAALSGKPIEIQIKQTGKYDWKVQNVVLQ